MTRIGRTFEFPWGAVGPSPPARMADVWTAAAQGQIGRIIELLTSDDPPVPEQLDGAGRTAAFYAQLNSHDGVARILQQRGWRMMEESELFDGPGGRRGFWTERDPPARRGISLSHFLMIFLSSYIMISLSS